MKPSASSATAGTKPGDARVTSTPTADAAVDIDVADIDRAADEGAQFGQMREDLCPALRHAIGDDDVDIPGRFDEARGIEWRIGFVQPDLRQRLQAVEAALAVILTPELRGMGQQDFHDIFRQ